MKLFSSAIISHQVEWQAVPNTAEVKFTQSTIFIRLGIDGKEREVSVRQTPPSRYARRPHYSNLKVP